jgi:hypothetical protein
MGAAIDIIGARLTAALANEREARERLLSVSGSIAYTRVSLSPGDAIMQEFASAYRAWREATDRREQAEQAIKELTEEGPYR